MRFLRTVQSLSCAAVLVAGTAILIPTTAGAAVACTQTALVAAINAANAANGGNVTLTPGCTYTLTTSNATGAQGPDGLPIITTAITLTGNNNTITRSTAAGTPAFRIAEVSNTGNFTLKLVTLNNGSAAGDGGGILNFGAVTLTGGGLTNNTATGTGGGLSNENVAAPATGTAATFTSCTVSGNTSPGDGGGIYNGLRGTLTTTSSTVKSNTSQAQGGGIASVNSTATSLSSTPVSANSASGGAGGIFRTAGTMTTTTSPVSGNTPNNCVGSSPSVPSCTS